MSDILVAIFTYSFMKEGGINMRKLKALKILASCFIDCVFCVLLEPIQKRRMQKYYEGLREEKLKKEVRETIYQILNEGDLN